MDLEINKRVLIITDSLGLPRPKPEVCLYEHTWPILLRKEGFIVHQLSIGGATISELFQQLTYHNLFNPDYIIIQSGIVDCAPRALGKFESLVLNKFLLTKLVLRLILPKYNHFLRKHRGVTYTSLKDFQDYIGRLKKHFEGKKLYWIGILPTSDGYEQIVPGISEKVNSYNNCLKEELANSFLPMDKMPTHGIMSDYIHLNASGHRYIFELIKSKLT